MSRARHKLLVAAVLSAIVAFSSLVPTAYADRPVFDTAQILVDPGDGRKINVTVEVAITPMQHQYGLMFVTALGDDEGMLFVFKTNAMRSFWMKNTLIPLDMLFFDDKGQLVNAIENVPPQTLESRRSAAPARYVLELKSGSVARHGIKSAARLLLPVGLQPD
ncbi:MAG: DUF192 domain-containing protein [Pseudomonadota bacterium]|nr:DUF192 domain-containing protein [Pseudomonadota bacterium]